MATAAKIIVVEDDVRMGRAIERHLLRDGHQVTTVSGGAGLRQVYREQGADLVLLDLNLGMEDGMDLARELVSSSSAALIIVTGRSDLQERIQGLDAGADDYVTKPFEPDELLARVRAVLRRHALLVSPPNAVQAGPYTLEWGGLTLTREGSDVRVRFTETQARIVAVLMQHHGRAVSRETLVNRELHSKGDRSVDVHVANVRSKLREAGFDDLIIWPVRGLGYRLRIERV